MITATGITATVKTLSCGSRSHANTAVVHCRKSGNITVRNTDTAMLAILNSLRRIINDMGKKFAREIEFDVNLTRKCISDVYIDGVCFPYQVMSVSIDDYFDVKVPNVNIIIPCGKVIARNVSGDDGRIFADDKRNIAEITAPDAYVALLNENERLKQMIEDQNRKISILLDT